MAATRKIRRDFDTLPLFDPSARVVEQVRKFDIPLFTAAVALMCMGTIAVFSATIQMGLDMKPQPDAFYFLKRHVIHIFLAVILIFGSMYMSERLLEWISKYLIWISLVMLGLLFTSLGITRYGATRWLNLFIVTFQPAELAKLAFVFYMAKFLEFRLDHHGKFYRGYARIILIYVLIGALFLKQPDVGSTIILAALLASMLFIAGTRIKYFAVLISLVIAVISFVILFSPERLGRLIGWIDPWGTKGGEGYQIVNSQISIGSGGLFGAGLGSGHQNIGGFLPEAHTDFIFAVIGEELGFVGITVLIILYGIIIVRGIQIALRIKDDFKRFLTFGLVMLIAFPCVVHPCVNLGIFPTKGLCLPMVSFGGSSIFVCGLIIGLLLKLGSNSCIDEEKRKVTV